MYEILDNLKSQLNKKSVSDSFKFSEFMELSFNLNIFNSGENTYMLNIFEIPDANEVIEIPLGANNFELDYFEDNFKDLENIVLENLDLNQKAIFSEISHSYFSRNEDLLYLNNNSSQEQINNLKNFIESNLDFRLGSLIGKLIMKNSLDNLVESFENSLNKKYFYILNFYKKLKDYNEISLDRDYFFINDTINFYNSNHINIQKIDFKSLDEVIRRKY